MWKYNLDLWPWKKISILHSSWLSVVQSCKILDIMVQSHPAYNVFLLCDNTTLTSDPWPSTIDIFLSLYWSIVSSCKILELTLHSESCLQHFPTTMYVTKRLWPLTLKNDRHLSLIMVINCTKLYDPGAYGSFCILPTRFSYYVSIQPLPFTND